MPGPAIVPPVAGQIWKAFTEGRSAADFQNIINSVHFLLTNTDGVTPVAAGAVPSFVGLFRTVWLATGCAVISNVYTCTRYNAACVITSLPNSRFPTRADVVYGGRTSFSPAPADQGANGSPAEAAFVTVSSRWLSAVTSRFTRAGMKFSPIADALINGNQILDGLITTTNAAMTALRAPIVDAGNNATWTPVQFSAKLALSVANVSPFVSYVPFTFPITGNVTSRTVGSELHRKSAGLFS